MGDKPDMSQMQHQWSYVVIPIGVLFEPLYVAHCRVCKAYFTKTLHYDESIEGSLGQTNLPEWGCILPIGV